MTRLSIQQRIRAPVQDVWDAITDHEGMVAWSPMAQVTLIAEGKPTRNGVGAVRRMVGRAGPALEERVISWEPPRSYAYELTRGAPVKNHRGSVELEADGDATRATWTVTFEPRMPGTGWLIAAVLRRAIADMLARLARNLEQRAAA